MTEDDQPKIPVPHSGRVRVEPEPALPDETESAVGKRFIDKIRAQLRRA